MKMLLVVLAIFALAGSFSAQQKTSAEIMFINGDIYPGAASRIQAIAVSSGKIIAAGSNQEVQKFKGGKTQLELIAARNYKFDRRLANFNTTPAPRAIDQILQEEQKAIRGAAPGG